MDITMQYYLDLIAKSPSINYYKTKKYIKAIRNEIYSYRSTAYLNRGKNIASICNYSANLLERQLNKVLNRK
jgi:hypothetical protein